MLNDVLRARYHWERGESEPALRLLNSVLAGEESTRGFYWTSAEVEHQLLLPFEIAVTNLLLTEDVLLVPFDIAFARLWEALPVQYLVLVLVQRALERERDGRVIDVLLRAAASGLLSTNPDDYDLSGKVVLDPFAYPEVVQFLGGDSFLDIVKQATLEDAWNRRIAQNSDCVINLFLYAVFHRERPVRGEMILIRLNRIADSHGAFLQAFARHLVGLLDREDRSAMLVSVGMRIDQVTNPTACLRELAQAIGASEFEPFVRKYFQFDH